MTGERRAGPHLRRAAGLLRTTGWPEAGRVTADILRCRTMDWVMLNKRIPAQRDRACRGALEEAHRALALDPSNAEAHLLAAASSFHLGMLGHFRESLERAVAAAPRWAAPRLWSAHFSLMENDPAAARACAELALRLEPTAWGHALRGEALLRLGDKSGALGALERCAALDRRRPWIWALRSEAHRDLKRFDLAAADLDELVRLDPGPWPLAMRARTAFNFRDKKKALRDLDAALRRDPGFMEGYAYRAEALRRVGRFKESLRDFNRVLSSRLPGMQRIRSWRGALLSELGRYEEAIEDFTSDIDVEREANIGWQLCQRAHARLRLGLFREAIADMNRAVKINPKNGWVFGLPGREGGTLDRCDQIVALLSRGVARHPRWSWGYAWRGETLARVGRFREALADLDRALALDARRGMFWAWRGLAWRGLGEGRKAAADFGRCIRLDARYPSAYGWRARLRMQEGKFAQALTSLDKLLRLDALCSWAYAWRGECRLRVGDAGGAEADLQKAVNLDNAYADAWAWLAETRRQKGVPAAALAAAERAVALDGDKGLAYLVRSLARGDLGDAKGQAADFKKAARLRPELFVGQARSLGLASAVRELGIKA